MTEFFWLQYNRGRRPRVNNWVFGIVDTQFTPARGYFEIVQRRNQATLLPIIRRCILPGSTIHWGAYRRLENNVQTVADHQVVVHRYNFVDPLTGVHTQNIEACWSRLKNKIKQRKGICSFLLDQFLKEQAWRDWRGEDDVYNNFKGVLRARFQFPV